MNNPKPFVAAMKDFFGVLPGTPITAFGAELRALTDDDKMEFWRLLNSSGVPCEPPRMSEQPRPAA